MEKNNQYSLADMRAYLRDELTEGERREMEDAMLTDPLLAGAMEALEERLLEAPIDDGSLDKITDAFRSAIPGNTKSRRETNSGYNRFVSPQIRRAIAVIILFAVGVWLLSRLAGTKTTPQDVFVENFRLYEDVISVRSTAQQYVLITESMAAYNAGFYSDALNGFEILLQTEAKEKPFVLLYAANSALALGKSDDAIRGLKKLDGLNHARLDEMSKWYLALAYLQKGEPDDAKGYLEALMKTSSAYAAKAESLMEELN